MDLYGAILIPITIQARGHEKIKENIDLCQIIRRKEKCGSFSFLSLSNIFHSFVISCLENMKYCHCCAMNLTVDRISESLIIICWVKALIKSHHDVWDWYTAIGILITRHNAHHELYINVPTVKRSEYDFAGEARNSGQLTTLVSSCSLR